MIDEPILEVIARLRPMATDGTHAAAVLDQAAKHIEKYGIASGADMEEIAEMQVHLTPAPCEHLARVTLGCKAGFQSPCPHSDNFRMCEMYMPEEPVTADELRRTADTW